MWFNTFQYYHFAHFVRVRFNMFQLTGVLALNRVDLLHIAVSVLSVSALDRSSHGFKSLAWELMMLTYVELC